MHLINLRGLKDGSLQLSLQMRRSACGAKGKKMLVKEKVQGFAPLRLGSKLLDEFYSCDWFKQRLELFLPEERIRGWKTVALILQTFKGVSAAQLCHLAIVIKPPSVAVLDRKGLGEYLKTINNSKKTQETVKDKKKVKMHRDSMALEENQLRVLPALVSTVS